jgi:hypothetical protein
MNLQFNLCLIIYCKNDPCSDLQQMEPLPKSWQSYLEHAGELMSYIKTYDQQTYEVQVEDNICNFGTWISC